MYILCSLMGLSNVFICCVTVLYILYSLTVLYILYTYCMNCILQVDTRVRHSNSTTDCPGKLLIPCSEVLYLYYLYSVYLPVFCISTCILYIYLYIYLYSVYLPVFSIFTCILYIYLYSLYLPV